MSDLYLMHHGIKGQKWGVRRFETADGHLTPAGKKRYAHFNEAVSGAPNKAVKVVKQKKTDWDNGKDDRKAARRDAAKKAAAGVAIAAGVLAAAHVGTVAMEEVDVREAKKSAKLITDDIMSSSFKDMSPEHRKAVADSITKTNEARLFDERLRKRQTERKLVGDTVKAYVTTKGKGRRARQQLRERREQGGYKLQSQAITKDNLKTYEKSLRKAADYKVNPNEVEAKARAKQRELQRQHDEEYQKKRQEIIDKWGFVL